MSWDVDGTGPVGGGFADALAGGFTGTDALATPAAPDALRADLAVRDPVALPYAPAAAAGPDRLVGYADATVVAAPAPGATRPGGRTADRGTGGRASSDRGTGGGRPGAERRAQGGGPAPGSTTGGGPARTYRGSPAGAGRGSPPAGGPVAPQRGVPSWAELTRRDPAPPPPAGRRYGARPPGFDPPRGAPTGTVPWRNQPSGGPGWAGMPGTGQRRGRPFPAGPVSVADIARTLAAMLRSLRHGR